MDIWVKYSRITFASITCRITISSFSLEEEVSRKVWSLKMPVAGKTPETGVRADKSSCLPCAECEPQHFISWVGQWVPTTQALEKWWPEPEGQGHSQLLRKSEVGLGITTNTQNSSKLLSRDRSSRPSWTEPFSVSQNQNNNNNDNNNVNNKYN